MQRRLDQSEMVQKAARGPVRAGQTGTGVAAGGATGGTAGHIVQGPGTQPQTVNQQPGAGQLAAQPAPVGGHGSVGPASPATEPQSVNQGPVSPGTPQAIAQAPAAPARGTPALPVLSGNDKVKVTLSGQIDRDLIFHGDGSGKLDTYLPTTMSPARESERLERARLMTGTRLSARWSSICGPTRVLLSRGSRRTTMAAIRR
jgi:hypothetical protein